MSLQTWQETLVNASVDGPTLTAAAAATAIPTAAKITLPNNYFYVGRMLRITAAGRISSVITTPGTARFDVRIGAVVAFDSLAILLDSVAAHTNVGWKLDLLLTCRSIGSGTSATLFGQGVWTCEDILGVPATAPKGVVSAILPWNSVPAAGTGFDSTAANTLDMFFTQTAATGSLTVHQYMVESLNLPMPTFWTSGIGGRSPHFGGGGLGAPGAPQGNLQTGGAIGPSANPVGNNALRPSARFTEFMANGQNGGPMPMFHRDPYLAFWSIIGVTRDNSGVPLGTCQVDLFLHGANTYVQSTVSDVGGNYLFRVPTNGPYFVRVTDSQGNPTLVGSSLVITPVLEVHMSFTPDSPQTLPMYVEVDREVTTYRIMDFQVDLFPDAPATARVRVSWQEGCLVDGLFVCARGRESTLSGANFLSAMMAPVSGGKSLRDTVRDALWTLLRAEGLIPPGTIG